MITAAATAADYEEGHASGVEWAKFDLRHSQSTSAGLAMLQDEARDATSRWSRAYYLGAARGYRSVIRTQKGGRWGT